MRKSILGLPHLALCCVAAFVSASDANGAEESLRAVFEYCQGPGWSFGTDGSPTTNAIIAATIGSAGTEPRPDPDRFAFDKATGGAGSDPGPFLEWIAEERSVPGESAFVVGWDSRGVCVLSERDSEIRCLKRFDVRDGTVECLTPTGGPNDLLGPIWLPERGDAGMRLAGVRWRTERGTSNEWFDARMAAADRQLFDLFPEARPEWIAPSPTDSLRWIVQCRFADTPPIWADVNAGEGTVRVLSRFREPLNPMVRRVFRWRASDGKAFCGIVSFPGTDGPFPLVVFPHGGPGAISDATFDERVWALVDAGFMVLQPNYRGSAGFGKAFRLAGWGPDGLRRALDDIHEAAIAVRDDGALPVAPTKPVLLGGSWGGWCVLEELALHPDFYAGGVSFFGAFDLPELVRSEAERLSADESHESRQELRALFRQFGDPSDAAAMERLEERSPARHARAVTAPVILFHNRDDAVIPFAQSKAMFEALTDAGCLAEFRAGGGDHGFVAAEEARIYGELVSIFHSWINRR